MPCLNYEVDDNDNGFKLRLEHFIIVLGVAVFEPFFFLNVTD